MWGLREKKINILLVNPDDPNALKLEDEDEEEFCWHYFVHYQGWNVKWDRWVEEGSLYVANDASRELAALLKKELDKIVKLQKKGGGGNDINVIRRRMAQLEAEFREEERREELRKNGLLPPKTANDGDNSAVIEEIGKEEDDRNKHGDETGDSSIANQKDGTDAAEGEHGDAEGENLTAEVSPKPKKKTYPKALLEKEKKLHKKHLEGKLWRKASHAQRIVLPFTLKKVMVEEWELITLCGMVPRLPSGVPIRKALDRFLQNKLQQLGIVPNGVDGGSGADGSRGDSEEEEKKDGDPAEESAELEAMENAELEAMTEDDETAKKRREWEIMVNGVAQFFDEALPVHLLYEQERTHHRVIMRSDDPVLDGKFPSEIYGCEYLLRLMVQFPTLLSESGLPESDMKTILSKMNELLRFLQKHQSELFNATYRKPEGKELKKRIPRKMKKDRTSESGGGGIQEGITSPHSGGSGTDAKKRIFADVSSSMDADLSSPATKRTKA